MTAGLNGLVPISDDEIDDDPYEQCDVCGEDFTPDELTDGLCDDCEIVEFNGMNYAP